MNTARRDAKVLFNIVLFVIGLFLVLTLENMNQPKQTSNERANNDYLKQYHKNAAVIDRTGHNHNGREQAVKNLQSHVKTL